SLLGSGNLGGRFFRRTRNDPPSCRSGRLPAEALHSRAPESPCRGVDQRVPPVLTRQSVEGWRDLVTRPLAACCCIAAAAAAADVRYLSIGNSHYRRLDHVPEGLEVEFDDVPGANRGAQTVAALLSARGADGILMLSEPERLVSLADIRR